MTWDATTMTSSFVAPGATCAAILGPLLACGFARWQSLTVTDYSGLYDGPLTARAPHLHLLQDGPAVRSPRPAGPSSPIPKEDG